MTKSKIFAYLFICFPMELMYHNNNNNVPLLNWFTFLFKYSAWHKIKFSTCSKSTSNLHEKRVIFNLFIKMCMNMAKIWFFFISMCLLWKFVCAEFILLVLIILKVIDFSSFYLLFTFTSMYTYKVWQYCYIHEEGEWKPCMFKALVCSKIRLQQSDDIFMTCIFEKLSSDDSWLTTFVGLNNLTYFLTFILKVGTKVRSFASLEKKHFLT